MPRMSRLSNPTGLIDLEKQRLSIVLDDQGPKPSYSLAALDLTDMRFQSDLRAIVIARRGNSELRTDHGPVTDWRKSYIDLSELGHDGTWSFRVLLIAAGSHKLIAAAENVRPNCLGDSDSIIGLEPTDELGQVPWELKVLETEGRAVIRFNRTLYQNAAAAEADKHFTCLVLPEAVRQLARWHAYSPTSIADEVWQPFKNWLTLMGVTSEPDESASTDTNEEWCREVVSAFCERFRGVEVLAGTFKWEEEE